MLFRYSSPSSRVWASHRPPLRTYPTSIDQTNWGFFFIMSCSCRQFRYYDFSMNTSGMPLVLLFQCGFRVMRMRNPTESNPSIMNAFWMQYKKNLGFNKIYCLLFDRKLFKICSDSDIFQNGNPTDFSDRFVYLHLSINGKTWWHWALDLSLLFCCLFMSAWMYVNCSSRICPINIYRVNICMNPISFSFSTRFSFQNKFSLAFCFGILKQRFCLAEDTRHNSRRRTDTGPASNGMRWGKKNFFNKSLSIFRYM